MASEIRKIFRIPINIVMIIVSPFFSLQKGFFQSLVFIGKYTQKFVLWSKSVFESVKGFHYLWAICLYVIYYIIFGIDFLFSKLVKFSQTVGLKFHHLSEKNQYLKYIDDHWWSQKQKAQANRTFILFLLPSLTAFIVFVITPFIQGLYLSLTDWDGLNNGSEVYVGFINYQKMVDDVNFYYSFSRTIIYAILNVITINIVAFLLALLVTQNTKLKNVYRAGFFMPNLIGGLVLGYIWQFIYNKAIVSLGGAFTVSLLNNPDTAMYALIAVVTWQYAGYIMMIYIAAIQNVPQDLIEASKIDGANALQRLRIITMPLIQQAFTVAAFLTLVTSFKQFDTVQSLTQGGPFGTLPNWLANLLGVSADQSIKVLNLVAVDIYSTAFSQNDLATGQAKAIVFFVFLLIISLLQVYYNKRKEIEL